VAEVARRIAYPPDQIRDLVYGTVLRDIGMIEISDLVLRSPRSLSPEEWRLIKQHPLTGVEILAAMNFSSTITDVVLYHHERFNGEGYPHGLRGAAIPLGARIVSVVESFVAMTRDLPYRAALSRGEALDVIRENWGMRYDPEVLAAFLEIVEAEGEKEPEVRGRLVGAR
jgi:HD-GYP domain-containing protein (c-di-GMP phosphodiesterase class II)